MSLHIIILAAGEGKRMFSERPKVLHPIGGKPMLMRVLETARQLNPAAIHLICGHKAKDLQESIVEQDIHWIKQANQLGTGHAVLQALPFIPPEAQVLILSGDVPLIESATLLALIRASEKASLALLTAVVENPFGLGRILRDTQGQIRAIREEKDASEAEKQTKEIYSGICATYATNLKKWLSQINNSNAQGEYYLTDIVTLAVQEKIAVESVLAAHNYEIQGINNRAQWQQVERIWQQQQAVQLLHSGIAIADAARIDIRGELYCGKDVFIDVNCVFIGKVVLGQGCIIEPNCIIKESTIGNNCHIFSHSVLDNCTLGEHCEVGPFARLRPGTTLEGQGKIGNFVETKNAFLGKGSKASHLSYLGDCDIGMNVNIGAGTITCNYDGANKHFTHIKDEVFIGSGTQLVAPITIEAQATIGAGSTIRANVPAGELTLTERKQKTVYGWKRPQKKQKDTSC